MKYDKYINIKQGSESVRRFSNGNTLPLIQLPFAMNAFCAQTSSEDEGWFFHPKARCLEGVRITHQPSPWISDYGTLIFMPQKFSHGFTPDERWSGYRPEEATFLPYYMKLNFLQSRCSFEITPSERGGALRLRFDDEKENYLSVLPLHGFSSYNYVPEKSTLYATVSNISGGVSENFKMYVVVRFKEGQISDNENLAVTEKSESVFNSVCGDMTGIHLKVNGKDVDAFLATSYISFEQAETNLKQDYKDFDDLKKQGEKIWEDYISRVEIESDDDKQLKTFYSCMYRAFLYPHKCFEIDKNGEKIHYSPIDGKIRKGVRYTDNGFWDTYRTVYPFFSIVAKDEYREMCRGFVNDYLECGWLPRWPSIGERGCMPSTLIDAVLCDGAVKGILDKKTCEEALEGMIKHATVNSPDDNYGRSGAEEYCKYGYVPLETHKESVNLTLDAAYGDWCIAKIAEILGKDDIKNEYMKRAENYKNLFDKDTGFMRARHKDGSFREDFSPTSWGRDYTEGSAWQNSFAVPHDIEGLARLYGGKEKLEAKIDELFETKPLYEITGYGCEIHEMTEMAAVDFGQCAISNQPSFHIPYIYSELGDAEKTSEKVKMLCEKAFSYTDDGFPGDEDNGSMALWYIFSTIGFYPFCPGKKEFVRTKKLCKKVKILGKEFDADSFKSDKIKYEDIVSDL